MVFSAHETAEEIKAGDLVSWIFDECTYDPDLPLLVDAQNPDLSLSWTQVKRLIRQLAAGFRAHGVRKGDCICIMSQTNIYYYPTVYGCIAAGATFYGAPTRWTPDECKAWAIEVAGATFFVVEPSFLNHAIAAVEGSSKDLSHILVMNGKGAERGFATEKSFFATWNSLLQHGEANWERMNDFETTKKSIAMRLNTGGTSGAPKVAQISHFAAIAHISQWVHSFGTHAFDVSALHYVGLNGISGHGFISTAMRLGFPVYLLRYSLDAILETCDRLKPSLMLMDPDTALRLAKMLPTDSQKLHSLRDIRCPAMDFPLDARRKLETLLSRECLISRPYGLTEIGTVSAMLYDQRDQNDPNSVGFTFPGVQIKLLDEDGSEITEFEKPGEILVKTPAMFSEYYNNPSATADAFRDGWFVTGDLGYISSATQQWYLIGRKKYVFQVGHEYVAPEEIESLLVSHPDVADAAIASIRLDGEVDPKIRAFVVPNSSGALTEAELLAFTSGKLAHWKTITGGITFVDHVPRNGLRKIIRWKLNEMSQVMSVTPPNRSFGKLYSFPGNPRTTALLAVAKLNSLEIELSETRPAKSLARPPDGVSKDYLKLNKLGKVPTFQGTNGFVLSECIAIAIYFTAQNEKTTLLGETREDYASILQWMSFGNSELMPAIGGWIRPILGRDPYNREDVEIAKEKAYKALEILEDHFSTNTYLVGDMTIADIFATSLVARGMETVLDREWRHEHPNITRWFVSIINQPFYKAVSESKMCDEPMQYRGAVETECGGTV